MASLGAGVFRQGDFIVYTAGVIAAVKAIPLQAWTGPEGSKNLRLVDFKTVGKVSPKHRPALPPRKYSWYSFLLEVESTP